MKILMLTPYLPYPLLSGGQIRTFNLLKKINKKHEITLFSLIKDESEKKYLKYIRPFVSDIKVFKRSKKPFTLKNILKTGFSTYPFLVIRNNNREIINVIKNDLKNNKYDLIHSETFYMMPHIPKTDIPILLVEQTIEYLGYESFAKSAFFLLKPFLYIDIFKIKMWEKYYWNKADKIITMSQNDKNFIASFIKDPTKIDVVVNGVDINWFSQKKRNEPKTPTILYVGTFKWLPNIEAIEFLVQKVWPLLKKEIPDIKLNIVGNSPTKKILEFGKQKDIKVFNFVEDIRDAFTTAHILLAPVFSGKGTRYKILEAMATKTPIVSTSIGIEGIEAKDKEHVLIADTPEEMVKAVKLLFKDKKLRQTLANNGKEFVKKYYDWDNIAKKLSDIYYQMGS